MKYRMPDIKTVDALYEILADPKKTQDTLAQMKGIRDEIKEGLATDATLDEARRMLKDSNDKKSAALELEKRINEECAERERVLGEREKLYNELTDKQQAEFAKKSQKLNSDMTEFARNSGALQADLDERLEGVQQGEDDVAAAKAVLAEREANHEEYVERVKAAV